MEHCRPLILIVIALSCMVVVTSAKASEKNPCANHAENDICGRAGKTVKRCRHLDRKCAGDHCRLVCVKDKQEKSQSGDTKSSKKSDQEPSPAPAPAPISNLIPLPISTAASTSAPAPASTSEPIPSPPSTAAPTSSQAPETDCPDGYSDDFDVYPGMVLFSWTLPIQTETGMYLSLPGSTPDKCKAHCIANSDCHSFDFDKDLLVCWLNYETALTKPSDFQEDQYYDYYARKCRSR